jgi:tRNA-2-methylthio-N6-dimethylallyladenosine synthase
MEKTAKKYHLSVFGCQMNTSDAEKIASLAEKNGYQKTSSEQEADLIVVVACSVRQSAIDRIYGKSRHWLKKRQAGKLLTILTGCVLDSDKKKLSGFFDLVISADQIFQIDSFLEEREEAGLVGDYFNIKQKRESDFSALVSIMTGCNNFCAYCVVPYTRGREVSRSAAEIIDECKDLIKKGYKEITLLGQNVNSYHDKKYDFPKLLQAIDHIPGDFWLKFLTSHPKDFSDDLLSVMKSGQHLNPYLHLAVQSGDKVILKNMNRKYTPEKYLGLIKKAKKTLPGLMLSTDAIVGFPGETREQFLNTVKLFKEVGFTMAFIAKYSPRLGTAAAKLEDDVSFKEKKERWQELTDILAETALVENKRFVGQKVRVLVDAHGKKRCMGRTIDARLIGFTSENNLVGQFVEVTVLKADSWGLYGKI